MSSASKIRINVAKKEEALCTRLFFAVCFLRVREDFFFAGAFFFGVVFFGTVFLGAVVLLDGVAFFFDGVFFLDGFFFVAMGSF